jgi:hypothetical protein
VIDFDNLESFQMIPDPDCPLQAAYMLGGKWWEVKLGMERRLFEWVEIEYVRSGTEAYSLLPIASSLWRFGKPSDAGPISPSQEKLKDIVEGLLRDYKALLDDPERQRLTKKLAEYEDSCEEELNAPEAHLTGREILSPIIEEIRNYLFAAQPARLPEGTRADQRAPSSGTGNDAEESSQEQQTSALCSKYLHV